MPTGTSPPVVASTARATDPTPNHWFAGLSRVHECAAVSASGVPNGRPITAVAVWYTGSPPAAAAGKRTRSIRSLPIDPDRRVRNSTRSAPSHSRVSAVIVRSPSGKVATSRDPAGERCARTAVAGAGGRAGPRSLRRQVPGALAPARVLVVFLLQHELVARPGQHLPAGSLVEHRAERAAARRVGGHGEELVLDRDAVDVRPARAAARGDGRDRGQRVAPVPERRHPAGAERQRHLGERAVRVPPHPLGERRHGGAGLRVAYLQPAGGWRAGVHGHRDHPVPLPGQPVHHRDGPPAPCPGSGRGAAAPPTMKSIASWRAESPRCHASRQPASRSRYTWSDSVPVIASWCAP